MMLSDISHSVILWVSGIIDWLMSEDKKKLLDIRREQLRSLSEVVGSLREDHKHLQQDNLLLSQTTEHLLREEETLDLRLKSVLR